MSKAIQVLSAADVNQVSGGEFWSNLRDWSGNGAALGSLAGAGLYSAGWTSGSAVTAIGGAAAYGGVIGGSLAVGYGIGTAINSGYGWASSSLGGSGSLGGDIYDWLN